eukprot:TRINITY_DN6446_c0_g3_i1.p1 TRINITY_DN6446_c0_g3~~TRINITY_DN6446_c0_g3_i1.p1  ORF type:complete len:530 (-),score=64.85 TRINITY_DN6446_c0_g3_i1:262-1617(-)
MPPFALPTFDMGNNQKLAQEFGSYEPVNSGQAPQFPPCGMSGAPCAPCFTLPPVPSVYPSEEGGDTGTSPSGTGDDAAGSSAQVVNNVKIHIGGNINIAISDDQPAQTPFASVSTTIPSTSLEVPATTTFSPPPTTMTAAPTSLAPSTTVFMITDAPTAAPSNTTDGPQSVIEPFGTIVTTAEPPGLLPLPSSFTTVVPAVTTSASLVNITPVNINPDASPTLAAPYDALATARAAESDVVVAADRLVAAAGLVAQAAQTMADNSPESSVEVGTVGESSVFDGPDCFACAKEFAITGGCDALNANETPVPFISAGCVQCGKETVQLCSFVTHWTSTTVTKMTTSTATTTTTVFWGMNTTTSTATTTVFWGMNLTTSRQATTAANASLDLPFGNIEITRREDRHCQGCALKFAMNGGCKALLGGTDFAGLIPDGCGDCGHYCVSACHTLRAE